MALALALALAMAMALALALAVALAMAMAMAMAVAVALAMAMAMAMANHHRPRTAITEGKTINKSIFCSICGNRKQNASASNGLAPCYTCISKLPNEIRSPTADAINKLKGRPKGTPAPNKGKSHRPPSTTISVRLPVSLLEEGRAKAKELGITWNRFAVQAILGALMECTEVNKA